MLIETYNLTKKYGKKLALNKVNLKIDCGQLVAYLGTNGAGKSTTINILTELLKPTSGTITYAKNLKIGVVFQNGVLDDFVQVSKHGIINLNYLESLEAGFTGNMIAKLAFKQKTDASRRYLPELEKKLGL